MIKKRWGIIFIIAILLILSINSAFAYDINGELDTINEDFDEGLNVPIEENNQEWDVPVEDFDEGLNAPDEDNQLSQETRTFANLNQDINENQYDEINLTCDYTFNSTSDKNYKQGISISRNLTINGNGHTLDGNNAARIFNITNNNLNVILKDLIFINGKNTNGGAIFGNSIAFNCTFINNNASAYGGAIYRGSAINCTFLNNTAKEGAAIYVNTKNITIADCTFENNVAREYGGAVSVDSTSNTIIANCTFNRNSAKTGGAVNVGYSTNTSISDSNFTGNNATSSGGAIYYDFAIGTLIDNCYFENNQALVNGGAFAWVYSNGNISHIRFKRNIAGENGGAIYINISNTTAMVNEQMLSNCYFIENHAKNGGAIYNNDSYRFYAEPLYFMNNSAEENGGAVYCKDSCELSNSMFISNSAVGNGGAVFCNDYCLFFNDEFLNNSAEGSAGAVFCNDYCALYKINFTGNSAYDAGAIYSNDYNDFYNLKFNNNTASNYGGALYCHSYSNFSTSEFIGNSAIGGSAIYISGNFNIIEDSTFLSNKAEPTFEITDEHLVLTLALTGENTHINAIYSWFDPEFNNVVYWNGTTSNTDIAVPLSGSCPGINFTIEIYDSNDNLIDRFNRETNGEGKLILDYTYLDVGEYLCKIYHEDDDYFREFNISQNLKVGEFGKLENILHFADDNSIINLTQNYTYSIGFDTIDNIGIEHSNLTINGNGYTINALDQSFPIYITRLDNINISNCNFMGKISFSVVNMTNFNFINCSFINSFASLKCVDTGTVHIIDSSFDNSGFDDSSNDGACEFSQCDNVIIENSNFTNIHNYYGTIFLVNNKANLISGCIFNNNSASSGGAINANYLEDLIIDNCSFFNNSASSSGGAIFCGADNLIVNNSQFMDNSANRGAAIRSDGMNDLYINSVFLNNKAEYSQFKVEVNDDLQALIVFSGENDFINAINSRSQARFENVTYWNGTIANTDISSPKYISNPGVDITIKIYDIHDNLIETVIEKTDKNNRLTYNILDSPSGGYKFVFSHEDDGYYTNSTLFEFNLTRIGGYETVGDFTILQLLIDNANDNDVINLTRDYTYSPELDTIDFILINKNNLTINGNGHTIDALNQSRLFEIDAENVTLENMDFVNGTSQQTLIYIWDDSINCLIDNCNFINNNPDSNYEDIFVNSQNFAIMNSNFINTTGIAIRLTYKVKNVTIENCSFINNTYSIRSAGNENILISKSSFINNSAIELSSNAVIIEDSNFTNNHGDYSGGAINLIANVSNISNSIFMNNVARYDGGAIYLNGDVFNIFNCTFIANTANGSNSYGGAMSVKANNTNISSCDFFNNSASSLGGALYLDIQESSIVDNSTFRFNSADEGAAINWWGIEAILKNSTLLDNKASSKSLSLDGDIDEVITIKFTGGNNYINAIYSSSGFEMKDVVYWNGEIINSGNDRPIRNQCPGQNITLEIYDSQDNLVRNLTLVSDGESKVYYDISDLPYGNYSFKAYHLDDEYYGYIGGLNGTFVVNRSHSSVNINIDNGTEFYYSDCNISFDIFNKTTARVIITNYDGSEVYINQTTDEDYVLVDLNPNEEYYIITVYNEPSSDYYGSQDSRLFKILKANSSIVIDPIPDVVYNNEFDISFDGEYLGAVNVTIVDGNNNTVFTEITTGKSISIPVLPVGTYNVTIINKEDDYHSESINSTIFNIIKASNYVNVTVDDVVYGEMAVIVVSADVDGDYIICVNGTDVAVNVVDGKGNASLSLDAGSYYANASFEHPNYDSILNNATFTVGKAINNVNVSVEDVVYGEKAVIVVKADVDGAYIVDINESDVRVNVENGEGNISLSLVAGTYYANATFNNSNYDSVVTNATFTVGKAVNNVNISVEDVIYGEMAVIVVSADLDYIYVVDVNGTNVTVDVMNGRGNASLSLDVGSYYANAVFEHPNYDSVINNATFVVGKATNNVDVSVEDVVYGEMAIVVVSADVDGAYLIDVNGTVVAVNVVDGVGNASLSLGAGGYYANATFNNSNYDSLVTNATFTVRKAANAVNVSVEDLVYGEKAVIVVCADVDGAYLIDVNGTIVTVDVVDGKGNASLSLGVGSYYANAVFEHPNYDSVVTNATFTVGKAINNVNVSVEDVVYGEMAVVVVSADVDGSYLVCVNGTNVTVDVVNGRGNASLSLDVGSYCANVTFVDFNYDNVIIPASFNVLKLDNLINVYAGNVSYGTDVAILISTGVDGVYALDVNGSLYDVSVVDGVGSLVLSLPAGDYYANVTFNDNYNYNNIINNAQFSVFKLNNPINIYADDVSYGSDVNIVIRAGVDGVYALDVNGSLYNVTVAGGVGSLVLSLPVGDYYTDVTFNDNDNYNNIVIITALFSVLKLDNPVNVYVGNVSYGSDVSIVVRAGVDGVYALDVNGSLYDVTVTEGVGRIELSLPAGDYCANVTFNDNDNYNNIINNALFSVLRIDNVTVNVFATNVTYGTNVSIVISSAVDDDFVLDVNGSLYDISLIDGVGILELSLPVGDYYANVTFNNPNYDYVISNALFSVLKLDNPISVYAGNVSYGSDVSVVIHALADGVYALDVNGSLYDVTVAEGVGKLELSLPAGDYYANVTFNDSANYNNIITNTLFTVLKLDNPVNVYVANVSYGNDVAILISAAVDGIYVLDVNGSEYDVAVSDGVGRKVLSLPVGDYYANVTFNDDSNYNNIISNALFSVVKANTSISITPISDVVYNNEINVEMNIVNLTTVNLTVTDMDGNVAFNVITTSGSIVIPALPAGTYNITAINNENDNYAENSDSIIFNVLKANSSIGIITQISDMDYGNGFNLEFDGDNMTNVNVTVIDTVNNVLVFNEITNNKIIFIPVLPVGTYNITAINIGDENHIASSDSRIFNVLKADNIVKVSVIDVYYGNNVIVRVLASVDGVYDLDINGTRKTVTVAGGEGSVSLWFAVGDYYANVTFDNPNYNSIIENDVFSVLPNDDYDIAVGANSPIYGDDLVVSLRLPQNATGNVSFIINGTLYSSMIIDGYAKSNIPNLKPGDYILSVIYSGDESYNGKTVNLDVHVKKVSMNVYAATYGWAKTIKYQARLIDEDGNAVSNKEVLFSINGKTFKSYSDANGYANVSLGLKIGVYNITASSLYGKITKKITIVSRFKGNKNINMYYFDGSKYSFKVYGNNGKLVGANQVIKVKINKKTYKIKTNKNGIARLTIPKTVKPGKYTITASYKGQTIKNTVKVKKILSSKKLFTVKRTAKKLVLTAKLKKKLKGKKITFKLNGKNYKAKTNKKGVAKVTIKQKDIKKLKKGKTYKVKISYYKTSLNTKVKVK